MKNLTKKELLEMKEAYDNAKGMNKEYDFSKGKRGAVVPNKIKARWIREWIGNDNDRMNFNRYVYALTDFLNEKLRVIKPPGCSTPFTGIGYACRKSSGENEKPKPKRKSDMRKANLTWSK